MVKSGKSSLTYLSDLVCRLGFSSNQRMTNNFFACDRFSTSAVFEQTLFSTLRQFPAEETNTFFFSVFTLIIFLIDFFILAFH